MSVRLVSVMNSLACDTGQIPTSSWEPAPGISSGALSLALKPEMSRTIRRLNATQVFALGTDKAVAYAD